MHTEFSTNGHTNRLPSGKSKPAPKPVREPRSKPAAKPQRDTLTGWAYAGVGLTLTMSALLNGYANSHHAPVALAGWAMGVSIPALVLILSRVGALAYRHGRKGLAKAAGAVALALLTLSVWHCAESVATLTGSHMALAVLMAVGIDCGLVVCELATVAKMAK